jgi:hypothetical protein
MKYDLKVGQKVGIVKPGSRDYISQGFYEVTKVNKVLVEVTRVSDGHVRSFSNRTGLEKGSDYYRSAEIVSVEFVNTLLERQRRDAKRNELFDNIRYAASNRNLSDIQTYVSELTALMSNDSYVIPA